MVEHVLTERPSLLRRCFEGNLGGEKAPEGGIGTTAGSIYLIASPSDSSSKSDDPLNGDNRTMG